jgi:hypothetical protein
MLFHKFKIGMTSVTCLFDVGDIRHRFGILAGKDIMVSVAVTAISRPLRPLHDHLGVKTLLILFLRLLMTSPTIHTLISSLLPSFGVGIILNMGVTIRTREFTVDGTLKLSLGDKKRNALTLSILLLQRLVLMTTQAERTIAPSHS